MSSDVGHTFGPRCRLAPVTPPQSHGALDGIPPLKAHFFYSSPISLDDPLSTATIVGAADSKSYKAPLQPFSLGDSNALDKAWLALGSDSCRKSHAHARKASRPNPSLTEENAAKLDAIMSKLVAKHRKKHEREDQDANQAADPPSDLPDSSAPVCCAELLIDASGELRNEFCALTRKRQQLLDQDSVIKGVMSRLARPGPDVAETEMAAPGTDQSSTVHATSATNGPGPITFPDGRNDRSRAASLLVSGANPPLNGLPLVGSARPIPVRPPGHDHGISGMPFVRVGTGSAPEASPIGSLPDSSSVTEDRPVDRKPDGVHAQRRQAKEYSATNHTESRENRMIEESADIPVGVSRLHKVSLPVLQMKPIYWSPVNDICVVMRATWFYK